VLFRSLEFWTVTGLKGDLAGANDYRDVLAELLAARMGVTNAAAVFPGFTYRRLGVFR
jgi:hypothetical protein